MRVALRVEPRELAIEQEELARRRAVIPFHAAGVEQQACAALGAPHPQPLIAFGEPRLERVELVVVVIDPLGQLVRALRNRQALLSAQPGRPQHCGSRKQNGGQKHPAAAPEGDVRPHWMDWVQLVPPAGSALMVPNWSLQKPRSPVFPTVSGTAVTS